MVSDVAEGPPSTILTPLANSVSTVEGLFVNVRVAPGSIKLPYLEICSAVPCKIEGDDSIGCHKVKSDTTSLWCSSVKGRCTVDCERLTLSDRSKTLALFFVLNV